MVENIHEYVSLVNVAVMALDAFSVREPGRMSPGYIPSFRVISSFAFIRTCENDKGFARLYVGAPCSSPFQPS